MAIIDLSRALVGIDWDLLWNLLNRHLIRETGSRRSGHHNHNHEYELVADDMVWEIFRRLPPKSLMRFKCISKQWNSIIRNPSFTKSYLGASRGLLILHIDRRSVFVVYPKRLFTSNFNNTTSNIIQAYHQLSFEDYLGCHDHYYLTNIVKGFIGLYSYSRFVLCNIATHQLLDLPNVVPNLSDFYLGFDPVMELYKVLRLVINPMVAFCIGIQIWTFGGGGDDDHLGWRSLDLMPCVSDFCPSPSLSTCINGILYLLVDNNDEPLLLSLLAFDLSTETFSCIIQFPADLLRLSSFRDIKLVQLGGSVAVITCPPQCHQMFIVRPIKNDDDTWTFESQTVDLMGMTDLAYAGNLPTGEMLLAPTRASDYPLPIYKYNHVEKKLLNWTEVHGYVPYSRYDEGDAAEICYHEDSIVPLDCLITSN